MNKLKKIKIRQNDALLYALSAICFILLTFTGDQGEPYALPLCYAMLANGLNLPATCLFFLLSGALTLNTEKAVVYACQALFLFGAFFLYRKLNGKNKYLCALFLVASIPFFILLFPLQPYELFGEIPVVWQKTVIGTGLFLSGLFFQSALKISLFKLTRCRLSHEELIHIAFSYCVIATGLYKCGGESIYFGVTLFCILMYLAVVKNATTIVFAIVCAVAPALTNVSVEPLAFYALYAGMGLLFLPSGRIAAVCAVAFFYVGVQFFGGIYNAETLDILYAALACAVPCLAFLFIPASEIKKLEKRTIFYRESHLSRIAINRNRTAIGERLFAVSNVFRRIESTFELMTEKNEGGDETARTLIREKIERTLCAPCPQREKCRNMDVSATLDKLIAVGCAKGKASLIDLPAALSSSCSNAGGILFCLNQQLGEYRKYMVEAENAQSGRELMASQAQGVSELLKNIALEQSRPLNVYDEKEKRLYATLAKRGVICSEILIYGDDDNICVSLTVFGKCENAKIVQAASEVLGFPFLTADKLVLATDKFCYTLRKKPHFDAAFGVAAMRKQGETENGDTHSVIRIDEKHFLCALSDGMGSGRNAERISESALCLLESFYLAGMPENIVLSTVNRLLSFNREETFACVDIAAVNLENGRADLVKIGSPFGFIFSEGTIRVLEGNGLPLGMLDELRPTTLSVQLKDNDVLVFLSDGITDAFGSSADLFDYLKTLSPLNPQALADDILRTALQRTDCVAKDDMTALAVRIFSAA